MPFKSGRSGNPSGRNGQKPIADALRAILSRQYALGVNPEAGITNAQKLALILVNSALAGELAAIKEVCDRVEGRSAQSVEHSGSMTLTHEESLALLENPPDDESDREDAAPEAP